MNPPSRVQPNPKRRANRYWWLVVLAIPVLVFIGWAWITIIEPIRCYFKPGCILP